LGVRCLDDDGGDVIVEYSGQERRERHRRQDGQREREDGIRPRPDAMHLVVFVQLRKYKRHANSTLTVLEIDGSLVGNSNSNTRTLTSNRNSLTRARQNESSTIARVKYDHWRHPTSTHTPLELVVHNATNRNLRHFYCAQSQLTKRNKLQQQRQVNM
jgi:hypothetical protein